MAVDARPVTTARAIRLRALGQIELTATSGDTNAVLSQRKRLALLAYLALAGSRASCARETLATLFWPDSEADAARHSLREALRFLRRALGPEVIVSRAGDDVALDPALLWTDVAEFERAIASGRNDEAIEIYRGALLEGFTLADVSSEFEHWLDNERARLQALAARAATALVDDAERLGNTTLAIRAARDCTRLGPYDEPAFRRLMGLLERAGDSAGALHAYDAFADRLARDLETSPSGETQALAARLRSGVNQSRPSRPPAPPIAAPNAELTAPANPPTDWASPQQPAMGGVTDENTPRRFWLRTKWQSRGFVATLGLAAVILGVDDLAGRSHQSALHVSLAVGPIRVVPDSLLSPGLVRQLVATDLGRIDGINVASNEEIARLVTSLGGTADSGPALMTAARSTGATQDIEGTVSATAAGALRIAVERVDLRSGAVLGGATLEAPDISSLADRVSAEIAKELGHPFPARPLAEVTSTSSAALRLYQEGLRSFYLDDEAAALRAFESAVKADSTLAMAWYYAALAEQKIHGDSTALRLLANAVRASKGGPERERLRIATAWAATTNSPLVVALAESLAMRFPLEADGDYWLGSALLQKGNRQKAIAYLRHALERDSTSVTTPRMTVGAECRACNAFDKLISAYEQDDSLDAAEAVERAWIAWQPMSYSGLTRLAATYAQAGRTADARNALAEASRLFGRIFDEPLLRARYAMLDGNFTTADQLLSDQVASVDRDVSADATWWLSISLRQQGRVRKAVQLTAQRVREHPPGLLTEWQAYAQALFEAGRYSDAAAIFESLAAELPRFAGLADDAAPGLVARHRVWALTHVATTLAAAGDTGRLVRLADSLEQIGALSAYGRDQLMHFYVRGLLSEARHDYGKAETEFRQAIYSPTVGYTRINLHLARVELALGRPKNAVATLQSALRGTFDGSNFYMTRTELHELLAQAFATDGQPDSARAHYAVVARAWSTGDAPFRARAESAEAKSGFRLFP